MIIPRVHGVGSVARILNRTLPEDLKRELTAAVSQEGRALLALAEQNVPVGSGPGYGDVGPGHLKRALKLKFSKSGLVARVGIYRDFYRGFIARFLEFGVRPHSTTRGANLKVSKRRYNTAYHPGFPARHWLLGLTYYMRNDFQRKFREAVSAALRKNSGASDYASKYNRIKGR